MPASLCTACVMLPLGDWARGWDGTTACGGGRYGPAGGVCGRGARASTAERADAHTHAAASRAGIADGAPSPAPYGHGGDAEPPGCSCARSRQPVLSEAQGGRADLERGCHQWVAKRACGPAAGVVCVSSVFRKNVGRRRDGDRSALGRGCGERGGAGGGTRCGRRRRGRRSHRRGCYRRDGRRGGVDIRVAQRVISRRYCGWRDVVQTKGLRAVSRLGCWNVVFSVHLCPISRREITDVEASLPHRKRRCTAHHKSE